MKKAFFILSSLVLVFALSAFTYQSVLNWKIDKSKAQVKFSLDAHGVETKGSFTGVKGDVIFDKSDLDNSSFNVTVDASTINTGNSGRDSHLKTNDFFGVEKFPVISFKSTKLIDETDFWVANGDLTIRDVTKVVSVPFTFENVDNKGVFKGKLTLNRSEYGVGKAGGEVGDLITVNFEVPVKK